MARSKKAAPLSPIAPPTDVVATGGVGPQLKAIDAQGKVPRTRVKDAKSLHSLFLVLLEADRKSQWNRTILEQMADGAPPHKDSDLQQQGMGWVYNLNFLEADTYMATALASYDDLCDSTEHLIVPEPDPKFDITPEDLTEALDIVSEEHATLIREHTEFYTNWNALATEFVGHGVGWTYFPDEVTPWWEPAGWDNILIPRKTKAMESAVTIFIARHEYTVDKLYRYIENPDYAKGWNQDEVKKAIVQASRGRRAVKRWYDYWPEIELELKNNDIPFGLGDAEGVLALHYWVREYDGSYSFYIGLEDGTNQDYLYQDENRYDSATQAFVSFTLGVGKKRTYHSIRGALWKMFPFVQTSNRFRNKILTNADIEMTTLIQGEEEDSYDDMQITLGPAIGYMPPSAKIVERDFKDLGTQVLPIVRDLSLSLQNATGQFQAPAPTAYPTDQKGNPPTKYQLQMQQTSDASLTSNAVSRFYRSMDRLKNEQWRRIVKIGRTGKDVGNGKSLYPEIKDFFDRCEERMKPMGLDAVDFITKGIRKVRAARAIGKGSPQQRMLMLDRLNQMAGALDETGRDLAARDLIAEDFGRTAADRYKPKVKRIAPDATIALIENSALKADSIPVLPDQNHAVHASIHVPKFQQVVQELVAYREQNPEANFAPMQPNLVWAQNLHDHADQHVQGMAINPLRRQDMNSYKAALEQGANLLSGFARELQQQERHAQENQTVSTTPGADTLPATTPGVSPGQSSQDQITASDPKLAMEMQRQQAKLRQDEETHRANLQLVSAQVAKVAQEMRLKQIESDAKVAQMIKASQYTAPV